MSSNLPPNDGSADAELEATLDHELAPSLVETSLHDEFMGWLTGQGIDPDSLTYRAQVELAVQWANVREL